jgi:hypothetical protein
MRGRCAGSKPPLGRRSRPYAAEIALDVVAADAFLHDRRLRELNRHSALPFVSGQLKIDDRLLACYWVDTRGFLFYEIAIVNLILFRNLIAVLKLSVKPFF